MKTFCGTVSPRRVTMWINGKSVGAILAENDAFEWGTLSAGAAALARILLTEVLGHGAVGNADATKYHQRLKHRLVSTWPKDADWTVTDAEIMAHVSDMRRIEAETAQMRKMIDREPAPVVMEGGAGIVWDNAERR